MRVRLAGWGAGGAERGSGEAAGCALGWSLADYAMYSPAETLSFLWWACACVLSSGWGTFSRGARVALLLFFFFVCGGGQPSGNGLVVMDLELVSMRADPGDTGLYTDLTPAPSELEALWEKGRAETAAARAKAGSTAPAS